MIPMSYQRILERVPEVGAHAPYFVRDNRNEPLDGTILGVRSTTEAKRQYLTFMREHVMDKENFSLYDAVIASHFIVIPEGYYEFFPKEFLEGRVFFVSQRPRLMLAYMSWPFDENADTVARWMSPISSEAQIGDTTLIGPNVCIGPDATIGEHCIIGPNTTINHAVIGNNVLIGANVSIGGDGFGYEVDEVNGNVVKFPHIGQVIVENGVEIMAGTCVCRGALDDTVIQESAKIDQLCHIAHGCKIGKGAFIIANTMLGGSTTVGDYAWVAPSTSTHQKLAIGNGAMTGIGSVVTKNIGPRELWYGVPARYARKRDIGGA